jgi:hypothetical protein
MGKTRKRYKILVRKHLADRSGRRKIWRLNMKRTVRENMK